MRCSLPAGTKKPGTFRVGDSDVSLRPFFGQRPNFGLDRDFRRAGRITHYRFSLILRCRTHTGGQISISNDRTRVAVKRQGRLATWRLAQRRPNAPLCHLALGQVLRRLSFVIRPMAEPVPIPESATKAIAGATIIHAGSSHVICSIFSLHFLNRRIKLERYPAKIVPAIGT